MRHSVGFRRLAVALFTAVTIASPLHAHTLPPNFIDQVYVEGWQQATGLAWGPDGKLYVWEKAGRVWVVEDGKRHDHPLIDISEEVGDWRDLGLLGFALDPDFLNNGHIYLLYAVDYHHLIHFGTPSYDPKSNEYFHDTISRLTRYTADKDKEFHEVIPGSRHILIGESISTGMPVCHQSHTTGSLIFATDGTLLVTNGDGASYENVDAGIPQSGSSNTALADGIITPAEDCGAFRCQLVNSLSGKVLRIDPATGDGVAGNPFYDPAEPRAPRSRVWALGLRNPFRCALRPGTGDADPAAADPGTLLIGDVGWNAWEELNVCNSPAQNFGWPLFEGCEYQGGYRTTGELNLTAPNPLFGTTGCFLPFYAFADLLIQDSLSPSWPNPCNINQQIGSQTYRFTHRRPALDWAHDSYGPARVGIFAAGVADVAELGAPECPVQGESFGGFSSTGGVWYTGTHFPPQFRDSYYHADFAGGWIRQIVFDNADRPIEVREFHPHAGAIVALTQGPDGCLYYINYDEKGQAVVRRISYITNAPPNIVASATPTYGPLPLQVQFSTAGTADPENQPIRFEWNFGDGLTSTLPNPLHLYEAIDDVTASGFIISRITQLFPPFPQGGGNPNIEIIRDNEFPPVGSNDSQRQYDTFHFGDQGDIDWIGYSYLSPRVFRRVIFQEGRNFNDGGWFDNFTIQYRVGNNWFDVEDLDITPTYQPNDGVSYETYTITFAPAIGTAIRIVGNPGGSNNFISVGELRVFAQSSDSSPRRFDATLTVTDSLNNFSTHTFTIGGNNTPPKVTITSPLPDERYDPDASFTQPLTAIVSDAEHSAAELTCRWDRRLIHDTHAHPEPPDFNCESSAVITPHGPDCMSYHWEFILTVTDADGLSTSATAEFFPECDHCPGDINADKVIDGRDLSVLLSQFNQLVTPGTSADVNHDGIVDTADMSVLLTSFGQSC